MREYELHDLEPLAYFKLESTSFKNLFHITSSHLIFHLMKEYLFFKEFESCNPVKTNFNLFLQS